MLDLYVVGPMVGGPLGGLLYERSVRPHLAGKGSPEFEGR